ncbi:hypothetical protein AB6A40_006026 [Gnathostoma spinigerum]|uniref:Sugar transporter SWEET n=1 Tax=Gnathostoma spinigerum TaxID=75299 RepID=A0ABD6EJD1_9BILA
MVVESEENVVESGKFLEYLSVIATVCTIGLFLTVFEICYRIKKNGSTDGISAAPLHMGFVSGFLWFRYGLFKPDRVIVFINGFSSGLFTFYLLFYFFYSKFERRRQQLRQIFIELLFLSTVYSYVYMSTDPFGTVLRRLGFCCMILNMATVGSPLVALRDAIRIRSTANLPLPLSLANLVVSFEWLLYGLLVDDFFIKFPNAVAVLMSVAQLIPFLIFPRKHTPLLPKSDSVSL